jgi:TatD DNase family protein
MLGILDDWITDLRAGNSALAQRPGVLHSFSGSLEIAFRAINLGFCIGVTGPITFPSAENRRQVVRALPLDRLLIETDAPFLAPLPHRGRRNEPAFVAHIADKIAQIKSRTVDEVASSTTANAARLFDWGVSD